MVVVTNEDRVNGAATMFYPGVMDEIGEKSGKRKISRKEICFGKVGRKERGSKSCLFYIR